MAKFVISPHFRLQEWVAEEKGYFAQEGLDYEFRAAIGTKDGRDQNLGDRVGAVQTIERGRRDVSAAYTHHDRKEFPQRFHGIMDTRRWGPGEPLVFEPYPREAFEHAFRWIAERGIFPAGEMGSGRYEGAVVSLEARSVDAGGLDHIASGGHRP